MGTDQTAIAREIDLIAAGEKRRRWPPYPAYKPSGLPWLGDIPAHWEIHRLKNKAKVTFSSVDKHTLEGEVPVRLCNYVDVYKNDIITPDIEFMKATASPDEVATFILREGDVLITKDSESWNDIAVSAYVATTLSDVVCGYHLALVRPRSNEIGGKFLFRAFQAKAINYQFEIAANGITRYGIGKNSIDNSLFPIPSLPEQHAIAAFLDRETARLDALIARKERLVELLGEKRAALISQAVTRGLDPDVPMKDSGVPWLGQIPGHWETKKLMRLTPDNRPIMYGIVLPGPHVDDGVPIVKGGDVGSGRLRLGLLNRTTHEIERAYVRSRLRGGDIVYAIRGSIGMVDVVPDELEGANLTQDAARITLRVGIDLRWLFFTLKAQPIFAQVDAKVTGATIRGINIRDLKRAVVPLPPMDEQRAIAAHLDHKTANLDALIAKVREGIERLREYRAALIAAAVTGKIEVRGLNH
jgi:type I restriction enzyme S subunit